MGMWEPQPPLYKHNCEVEHKSDEGKYYIGTFQCYQYTNDSGRGLKLRFIIPQCCHDDTYEVKVTCCPFCGYNPEKDVPKSRFMPRTESST